MGRYLHHKIEGVGINDTPSDVIQLRVQPWKLKKKNYIFIASLAIFVYIGIYAAITPPHILISGGDVRDVSIKSGRRERMSV